MSEEYYNEAGFIDWGRKYDESVKIMPRRSKHNINLLIYGYMRSMDKIFRVPDVLATVVDLFHGSYNGKLVTTRHIDTMIHARKVSEKKFEMIPGCFWTLETDPLWRQGSLDFFLKLVSSDIPCQE